MIGKFLLTTTVLAAGISAPALAKESLDARIAKLEQEIQLLKQQAAEDKAEDSADGGDADVELGKKGLKITSGDGKSSLRIRGYAQADSRTFFNDDNDSDVDNFLIRRARPIVTGEAGDFGFNLTPDFGGGNTKLQDAFAEYKPSKAIKVRAGKFKSPLGLDQLKSDSELTFVERSLPSNFVPSRDIGVMAYGDIISQISYEIGVFNGGADNSNEDSDADDNKDIVARVMAAPFKETGSALKGLGFGVAGSFGERDGSLTSRSVGDYKTPGQATFFRYKTTSFGNGDHWRLAPQAYFYSGPFGLLAEYTVSSQEIVNGATRGEMENTAWEGQVNYVLTGEDATYKGVVSPDNPFEPSKSHWGAWEVGARYGVLTVDDAAFPVFADPAASAGEARSFGAVTTGYLNDTVKLVLDYEHTDFDGGAAAGADRETEQVLLTRMQFKY